MWNQLVTSIADAGRELLQRRLPALVGESGRDISALLDELVSHRGEALGTALARELVARYQGMTESGKEQLYRLLSERYSVDPESVLAAADNYRKLRDDVSLEQLAATVQAPRRRLLSRMNMASGGTETLVALRADLLKRLPGHPEWIPLEHDLESLLGMWFNRGFLTLQRISWQTPAHILEKLIHYEAVHAMSGWDDLRRRLAEDRRCFAFFHPALTDEPLIFVEVALVKGLAGNVQRLLEPSETHHPGDQPDTAIFYSINNCQAGLKGISFGNFLIKQVVMELQRELPQLKQFATLSPAPGFRHWLTSALAESDSHIVSGEERKLLALLESPRWQDDPQACDQLRPVLLRLCAQYLLNAKRGHYPLDPVARFHLGNGAALARINWQGDVSPKGLAQSAGILVNYRYDQNRVEEQHEAYINDGIVAASSEVTHLLKP